MARAAGMAYAGKYCLWRAEKTRTVNLESSFGGGNLKASATRGRSFNTSVYLWDESGKRHIQRVFEKAEEVEVEWIGLLMVG